MLEELHEENPDNQEIVDALAVILARSGNVNEATYYAKLATVLESDPAIHTLVPEFFRDFAQALDSSYKADNLISAILAYEEGDYAQAIKLCRNNIKTAPNNWKAYSQMGKALMKTYNFRDAITSFQTTISGTRAPNSDILFDIATCQLELGQFEDCLYSLKVAHKYCNQAAQPENELSRIIEKLSHLPLDCRDFKQALETDLKNIVLDDVDEAILIGGGEDLDDRKIRIAYLSDSFYDCPKGHFIERALTGHDKSKFEIFCYQQNSKSDSTTSRIKVLADDWRDVGELDDLTAAYLITCDGIDILIDTIGVSENQRINVIAQKPAPIVLSWLNSVDSSSFCEIDDILTSEKLTNGGISFDAGADLFKMDHTVNNERAENTALILTACCNLGTMTPDTFSTWAEILLKLPNANILFGGPGSNQKPQREKITSYFMNYGLANRIFFQNSATETPSLSELLNVSDIHLSALNDKDVNTTASVLASGTPTIVFQDKNAPSSSIPGNGDLILNCQKEEWLASSSAEYIEKTCAAAEDYQTHDKAHMHTEIIKTPPYQVQSLAKDLEGAYINALKSKDLI
ncbi:hypothetical protein RYZ26_05500 [Terasakiella sp. A23]|uniref:O-linked N-acetylglucosamine transferase family protein n=1 Tax=Terasakiella sp. FCG-A23 TaxID=3080561 RepID=UPI0029542513|nr:hypothetical protein [Terasakiella sp. A23]MDV7339036.1 hypothetical protein [Terasakiella sp. A23]